MSENTKLAAIEDFCKLNANSSISSLGGYLQAMSMFGYPRLSMFDNGWHSYIEVFVTGKGVKFDVKSEFGHTSPIEAVKECSERLIKALNDVINTKGPDIAKIGD